MFQKQCKGKNIKKRLFRILPVCPHEIKSVMFFMISHEICFALRLEKSFEKRHKPLDCPLQIQNPNLRKSVQLYHLKKEEINK